MLFKTKPSVETQFLKNAGVNILAGDPNFLISQKYMKQHRFLPGYRPKIHIYWRVSFSS